MIIIDSEQEIEAIINTISENETVANFTSYVLKKEDAVFHEGHSKMAEYLKKHFNIVIVELIVLQNKHQIKKDLVDYLYDDIILSIDDIKNDIQAVMENSCDYFFVRNIIKNTYNNIAFKVNEVIKNYETVEETMPHRILIPSFMSDNLFMPIKNQLTWCKSLKGILHHKKCTSHRKEFYNYADSSLIVDPPMLLTPIFRDSNGLLYSRTNPEEILNFRLEIKNFLDSCDLTKPKQVVQELRKLTPPSGYFLSANWKDIKDVNKNVWSFDETPEKYIIYCVIDKTDQSKLNRWKDCRFIGIDETKTYDLNLEEHSF